MRMVLPLPDHRPSLSIVVVCNVLLLTLGQLPLCCQGCFQSLIPLKSSSVWVQATGVQSYLQYKAAGDGDTIQVIPRGKDMSGQATLTCVKAVSPNKVIVQLEKVSPSTRNMARGFMCLRVETLSKRVLRIHKTETKGTKGEVDCDRDEFTQDNAVLVDAKDELVEPCLLQGSYQVTLHNDHPHDSRSNSGTPAANAAVAGTTACMAKIHFNCNNKNVVATFGAGCKPPIYKYYTNRIRYHSSTYLSCVGGWTRQENDDAEYNVMVLRSVDLVPRSSLNIWCLHYKTTNYSGENFVVHLSFDGRCADMDPLNNDRSVFSKDTMYGHMANFVSARDARCSDKFYLKNCQNRIDVNCLENNACPRQCGRCYSIPEVDTCKFMPETMGSWEVKDSKRTFSVSVNKNGIETSKHGKYSCRRTAEKSSFYINPVMQYDSQNSYCMPTYACMQIFSLAPGVSTFYLRQAVVSDSDGESIKPNIATCERTNNLFEKYPLPEGEKITVLNEMQLKPMPCNFGDRSQYPTTRGYCLFNVEACSGKACTALNVSYDNETCHENPPVLPVAQEHQCYGGLKFEDGVRGLITYSQELGKYACWVFTSTRLFITEPMMCNLEAVRKLLRDKYAAENYDPIKAFTVPPITAPSSGKLRIPNVYLHVASCTVSILVVIQSLL